MSQKIADNLEREGIKIASTSKRLLAFSIDGFIISVLFILVYQDLLELKTYTQIQEALSGLLFQYILMRSIYHGFFVWYFGATPGKMLVKIACMDIHYLDKPNLLNSFLRAFFGNVSEMCFYLGFIWAFGNPLRQTWHDYFAKTVVIDVA